MALVKYGGGIIQMSGSIAGTTFARNRYGNYARARTVPTNPQTAPQTAVRSAMALLSTRWAQTLTAAQRTAWNLYGQSVSMLNRLGESTFLTGYNHYIRSNLWFARVNLTIVDDGPTTFEIPDADPTVAVTFSEAAQTISVVFDTGLAWANEDDGWMEIYQGSPQNAQRNFFDGPWRYVAAIAGATAGPPVSPAAPGVVFATTEGQRNWAYFRIRRADGRLSQPFRDDAFVVA